MNNLDVIVFAYNQEKLIERALNSIIQQITDFRFRIIFYDDASTDATVEVAEKLLSQSNIQYEIHANAVNQMSTGWEFYYKAFTNAKSRYCALIDGDDFWTSPHKLQAQWDVLESNENFAICHTGFEIITDGSDQKGFSRFAIPQGSSPPHKIQIQDGNDLARLNFIGSSTVMFRRALVGKVMPKSFERLPFADYALWSFLAQGRQIAFLPESFSAYLIHENNFYANDSVRKKQMNEYLVRAYIYFFIDEEFRPLWKEAFKNYVADSFMKIEIDFEARIDSLENAIDAYEKSISWKVTEPFRRLVDGAIKLLNWKIKSVTPSNDHISE